MSDEQKGLKLFPQKYAEEVMLAQAAESGLPVGLIKGAFTGFLKKLYDNGYIIGFSLDNETKTLLKEKSEKQQSLILNLRKGS